ncbi:unnamed protein product [Somion occarium]|uniref:DUF6535 domain-containing protein n=1 Tax=Somion occarium TaxID=3059160 RepID=A0ABP1CT19_9APHY
MNGIEWDGLAGLLKDHDQAKVESCNNDIDSLLILTGLFSAIVAAFTIESYKNLQPDPSPASATLLAQLVLHFNGTAALEATGFSPSPLLSEAASLDVLVNSFWFVSLLCTLMTASIGIFMKTWLRDYLNLNCSSAEERIRVRQVRHEALVRWRVFELAAFLPLLLQLGLLLFLIGLALFLRPINIIVGWIMIVGTIIWVAALAFIIIMPFFSATCPYQLAFFKQTAEYLRGLLIQLRYGPVWRQKLGYENPYYRFPGDERGIRREQRLNVEAVIGADASLNDNAILEQTLQVCAQSSGLKSTLKFTRQLIAHRLERPITNLKQVKSDDFTSIPRLVLDVLFNILCDSISEHVKNDGLIGPAPDDAPPSKSKNQQDDLIELVSCFYTLVDHSVKSKRSMYLHTWPRVTSVITSGSLPDVFLEPSSNMSPGNDYESKNAVKSLLDAASTLTHSFNGDMSESPRGFSLARAVFEHLGRTPAQTLQECIQDLAKFNGSLVSMIQASHVVAEFDAEKNTTISWDVQRALVAAEDLNSRMPGLVGEEVIALLKRNCPLEYKTDGSIRNGS